MADNKTGTTLLKYLGMTARVAKAEWAAKAEDYTGAPLTPLDKEQLTTGVMDGSLTYEPTQDQVNAARARTIEVPGGPDFTIT